MLKNENLDQKIAAQFVDRTSTIESPNIDMLDIPSDYSWGAKQPRYPDFDLKMHELGWGTVTPREYHSAKYQYLYDHNISADFTTTVYHGTSAAFHKTIQDTGLDSSKGKEINPGAMSLESGGVCCTSSFDYAESYSKITVGRMSKDSSIDQQLNVPIVYRWNHSEPVSYGAVTPSRRALNANELHFSLNGEEWYPADKFNIKQTMAGKWRVTPNYENKEIQEIAASMSIQNTTANIFSLLGVSKHDHQNTQAFYEDKNAGTDYENDNETSFSNNATALQEIDSQEEKFESGYGTPYENQEPQEIDSEEENFETGYGTPYENEEPQEYKDDLPYGITESSPFIESEQSLEDEKDGFFEKPEGRLTK